MKREFLNKKQNSYLQVYDEYRKKYTEGYGTEYSRMREEFGENMGLAYNVISSGDYDSTTITSPLEILDNVMSTASFIVDPFTIGSYKNVAYNEPLVWSIDRWYLFDIVSNGNEFKLGFYGGDAPLSSTTSSSIYPPNFYYESISGNVYMGLISLKNIGANKTRLMIRIDSNYNFYIGTDINKYWLIGNCLSYMSIINTDTYTIRWGYEVHSLSTSNTIFDLVNGSYSNIGNIDGVTWPNYRYGGPLNSNRYSIDDIVDQSNAFYKVYPIRNYSNDVTSLGQRTSFTLQCSGIGVDQVALFISPTPLLQTTYNRSADIAMELALEFVVYDTISNVINAPQASVSMQLPSYPNLNNTNGQIYFRIEEDGKIYASKDKGSAVLICTRTYAKFYISLIVKGYSGNKQCQFKFISHNTLPIAPNPIPDPLILSMPMLNKTASIFLPNGNTTDSYPMTAGKYYTTNVDSSPPLPFGLSRWYSIDIGNVNNGIKIGFYTNTSISNHTETSTSVNPPQFYYSTSDRGVYMGGILKKTLPNDWTVLFLLVDENLDFYVGYGEAYYYLIDNITNYMSYIFPDTYTIRLGWEVFANTSSTYNLINIAGGYYQSPSYELTWPNNRIYDTIIGDYNDVAIHQNSIGVFKHVNFLNYSNAYSAQGSFTLQNVNTATNTEVIVILFNDITNGNNSTTGSYATMLGSNHLIYKLSTNQIIHNGTSIGTPSSYPDLNTANGQIYWEFNGGQVYLSRDRSNKVLLSVSIPSGNLYGGIITSSATTSSSTFKFIQNNVQAIVPPPGPPLPPSSGSSIPAPTVGTYSSALNEHNGKWVLSYSITPGQETLFCEEYSYGQAYADKWQSTLVFDFTITNFKIGVGLKNTSVLRGDLGTIVGNTKGAWNTSNYYLYYYYDSTSGNVYKDNVVIYSIQAGLTTVGFSIDEYYNVYVVTSTDFYNIGSYLDYYNSNINVQMSVTYGIVATPSTSPFNASSSYTVNTSKTKIYTTVGDSIFALDGIYNRILYDVISSFYKLSITASSTTNYKYVECKVGDSRPPYISNYRYMFRFTIAPTDVILLWGRAIPSFTPGSEYTLSQVQTPVGSNGCITYVSSTSSFYANNVLRQVLNLNLSIDNTTLYFDQANSSVNFNAGANYASRTNVNVNKGVAPLGVSPSNFYFPFMGFFIKTSSPSSYCQIDAIPIT